MMFYQGELWPILTYFPPERAGKFEGKTPMGWFWLGKKELIHTKKGSYYHWTYRGVWEDNPLQPYQLYPPL